MSFVDELRELKKKAITTAQINNQKRTESEQEYWPKIVNKLKQNYIHEFEDHLYYNILPEIKTSLMHLAKLGKDSLTIAFTVLDFANIINELPKMNDKNIINNTIIRIYPIYEFNNKDYFNLKIPDLYYIHKDEWFDILPNRWPVREIREIGTYMYQRLLKSLETLDLYLEYDSVKSVLSNMTELCLNKSYTYKITMRF